MSDLRTRIAAAIGRDDCKDYHGTTDGSTCVFCVDWFLPKADAVIAALNESATECWDYWPARRCVILGTVNGEMTDSEGAK